MTAGGDRCVRFWSLRDVKTSRTVCEVEYSRAKEVYEMDQDCMMCSQVEKEVTAAGQEEVKPVHEKAITGRRWCS